MVGRPYAGRYSVEKGVLSIKSAYGTRSALLGEHEPDWLAATLLTEIMQSAKVAGDVDAL